MSISTFLELALLDAVFNSVAYDNNTGTFVKLHTGDPGEAGTSNAASETDRVSASFGAAASGAVANDAAIEWTSVAASETYSHISIWDDATAGNHLWYGALTTPKAVNSGDTFRIPIGDLTITLE